ncbi:MAG: hypothetical protein IJN95_03030 [Clostridia bacterium]|nr:hypothetical protein [Clostridia bacterium]
MKKILVFLLTFILTFSCFGILSVGSVFAENQTIIESDFDNSDGTNWVPTGTAASMVEYLEEDGTDFVRINNTTTKNSGLKSVPFELIPDNDYELTFYFRIPTTSPSYVVSGLQYAPTIAIYQTGISDGVAAAAPQITAEDTSNNIYSYSHKSGWERRPSFSAEWTLGDYGTYTANGSSLLFWQNHTNYLKNSVGTFADINALYSEWTKITVKFTAEANLQGEKTQSVALAFFFADYAKAGHNFDIKEVELVKTTSVEPEEPEEIVLPDNIPEYPAVTEKTESTGGNIETNVSGENCHAFVTKAKAVSGEKVAVSAAPFAGYKFVGWYENDELVTAEKHFTFNASENRTLVAKVEPITEENKEVFIIPDVNYDGVVGLEDISSLAKKLAGWELENVNDTRADVDGDGKADLYDLVLAAQYAAGWKVQDKLASKEAYDLPQEDLTAEGLAETVRAGESEYFNRSTILNEGNRALFVKLFEKAKRGEKITVASIGGSITQGVNSNGVDRSYGQLVSEWIANKFNVEVENINAGIGSTGSLMGVHRLQSDVLSKNPDLVILEYSVNDISSMQEKRPYLETYEAIIRRVLEKDIALMTAVFGGTASKFYTDYLSLHIHSALHYDLPVIDYYSALFRYLDGGVIKWYDKNDTEGGGITKDNLHPNFAGHVMISSAMNYYLEDVYNKYEAGKVFETALTLPEETLFENTNPYNTATFYAGDNTLGYEVVTPLFNEGFTVGRVTGTSTKLGKGWVCSSGNGVIIFEFKNITSLLIPMMNCKTLSGKYSIEINGVTKKNNVSVDQANNATWPIYAKVFDKASNVVIKITCHEGTVGVGPIGVTY